MIKYKIDNKDLRDDYGIFVSMSKGLIDIPQIKELKKLDFANQHGDVVNAQKYYCCSREIVLDCFLEYQSSIELIEKTERLNSVFRSPGFKEFEVIVDGKELFYLVYAPLAIQFDKKWGEKKNAAKFSLKLIESEPIKKVLKFKAVSEKSVLEISSEDFVSVYFKGEVACECLDNAKAYLDTKEIEQTYNLVFVGNIESLSSVKINDVVQNISF